MAHDNLYERRAAVKIALGDRKRLEAKELKNLAEKFGCTQCAIRADIIELNFPNERRYVTQKTREKVIAQANGICYYCHQQKKMLIVEHKIPTAVGGSNSLDNLVATCDSCNIKKAQDDREKYSHLGVYRPSRKAMPQ